MCLVIRWDWTVVGAHGGGGGEVNRSNSSYLCQCPIGESSHLDFQLSITHRSGARVRRPLERKLFFPSLVVYIHETIGHDLEIAPSRLETQEDRCIDPTDLATNPHRASSSKRVLPAGLSVQPACRRSVGDMPRKVL